MPWQCHSQVPRGWHSWLRTGATTGCSTMAQSGAWEWHAQVCWGWHCWMPEDGTARYLRDGTAGCLVMPWPGDPVMPQLSARDTAQPGAPGWHSWVSEDGTDECLGLLQLDAPGVPCLGAQGQHSQVPRGYCGQCPGEGMSEGWLSQVPRDAMARCPRDGMAGCLGMAQLGAQGQHSRMPGVAQLGSWCGPAACPGMALPGAGGSRRTHLTATAFSL